jgi:hypothetical protein
MWDKRWPKLADCEVQQEICSAMEAYLAPCACGGRFIKGSAPRCPHCNQTLPAEFAATYIERNAPGAKKGWQWQRSWSAFYCIVVQGKRVDNNWLRVEEVTK